MPHHLTESKETIQPMFHITLKKIFLIGTEWVAKGGNNGRELSNLIMAPYLIDATFSRYCSGVIKSQLENSLFIDAR